MKIKFLGTGAADWDIKNPENDPMKYRRFSSAVIDGTLLIDPGPCVYEFANTFGYDISGIKYVVNTHRHGDHFCPETLEKLVSSGAVFVETPENVTVSAGKYEITAYKANHSTCPGAVHFMISDKEKRLYYALDGAWLLYDEYKAIKNSGVDMLVLDLTVGEIDGDFRIFEHNDLNMVLEMQKTLKPYVGRFVVSHMARTLHPAHPELQRRLSPFGITAAYDGLELEV